MCGIAGYIGKDKVTVERIKYCLSLMNRRGPDYSDYYESYSNDGAYVCLLHSRLSIIDLDSRSNQPFMTDDSIIVFNGEIYNYLELKARLSKPTEGWRTKGDTEILAQLLNSKGAEGLNDCEGMWALACYNESDNTLLLSRDRFGEKPLYIWKMDNGGMYFGSEIKFITALNGCKPKIDINKLLGFLVYGFRTVHKTNDTFFQNITMLPQASVLSIGPEGEQLTRYWRPAFKPEADMTYEEAVHGARERLIRSVELRLRSDVPLAFCMSGGVDSNGIISIAKKILNYNVHGFTFVTNDNRYDEKDLIQDSISTLGINHTLIKGETGGFLSKLRKLVRYHDAPLSTVTWYANWMLMEGISKQKFKIAVNGIAADELFSGYYDHHLAYLYEMSDNPEKFKHAMENWSSVILPEVRNPYLRNPKLFIKDPAFRKHHYLNADRFESFVKRPVPKNILEKNFTKDLLRNRMLNELFFENVPVYMHEEDLNAMYFSIENRTPYLDKNLFEFCYTIPTKHLIKSGKAKSVLRDCLKGIANYNVVNCAKKIGFNASVLSFLNTSDPEVMEYVLDDSPICEFVHKDAVKRLCEKDSLSNSESKFLFSFLNCKMFMEEFL